jgi:hypothetical protein
MVEPLPFLSLLKWLEKQAHVKLETNLGTRLAFQASRGEGYEELIVLYLLRKLRYPISFSTIFNFYNAPVWANDMVQIDGCLKGRGVVVDVLGEAPENPGLGVVDYAAGVEDVIRWIEDPDTASAVLVSTNLFGPDVMIRCRSAPSNSTVASKYFLMGQLKSYTHGNKESLDVKTISKALTSLAHDHWFKQMVCQLASSLSSPH